ncbi:MAG TPA: MFS transporter [Pyrinomonadaceae bacterium]|nr:MFS transporter [Pyrinomonadaceae bacterium]
MSTKGTPPNATPTSGETTPAPSVPKYSYYALLILSLVNFLNYIDRQVLPAVAPIMLKDPELGLNDAELGYMETALLLSFTVLAPLFGRLGDRYPRAKIMASAAVVWSLATALTGFADRLPFMPSGLRLEVPLVGVTLALSGIALTLCFIRALVGVGESAYSTITPSLIADYFPPQQRATALGVFQAAIPMGFALGFVIGGLLAYFFGWRAAFMIVGVPGLLTAVLVWRLREPARGATDEPAPHHDTALEEIAAAPAETARALSDTGKRETTLRNVWNILKTRDWMLSTAGYTALTFALGAMATWATVVMERDKGMSARDAAITLGVVSLLAGATGTFGGGWLADRIKAYRHNAYFLVCAVSTLLGIVPTIAVLVADSPYVFLPAIFLAVMLLFVSNAPFHAILLESVPVHVRAMAVALNIVIIHTFGDAISRALVGVLSESLKAGNLAALAALARAVGIDSSRQQLSAALLIVPAALVVSTLFFFAGAKAQKRAEI